MSTQCVWTVGLLVLTQNFHVWGLSFLQEPVDQFVVPNSAIWWHCRADSPITKDLAYSWTLNGSQISRFGSQHQLFLNGTLNIDKIQATNSGQYQCSVGDGVAQIESRVARLAIAYIGTSFSVNPDGQSRSVGSSASFLCEIDSQPPPVLSWLHNEAPVTKDTVIMVTSYRSQLTVSNIGYSDGGRYQCVARNPLTNQTMYSTNAVLTVQGGPEWILEPSPTTANKNSIVYLYCEARGNPEPVITWYSVQGVGQETAIGNNGRFVVFGDGSLRITDAKEQDQGFYKCQARNSVNAISKTVLLTITELPLIPTFTSSPTNTTVKEGETVNWFCAATGEPPPVISWRKENGRVGGSRWTYPLPGALVIKPVSRADIGWFLCHAENAAGKNVHRVYLDVQYPPSILAFPQPSLLVEAGDRVHLDCQVDSNPSPEITWTTPLGDKTESNGMTVYSNGSLVILSASPAHMGQYSCMARNYLDFVSSVTLLQVRAAPVFLTAPQDQDATLGSPMMLHCQSAGYPDPTVIWYLPPDDREITMATLDNTYKVLGNGSLVVQSVGVQQEGKYRCTAENSLGQIEGQANVRVLGPPMFNRTDYSIVEHLGSSVLLECEPTGRPNPIVQWVKGGVPLVPDTSTTVFPNNSLYISRLQTSHYGDYQCYATNEVGSARLEVKLLQPNSPVFIVPPFNMTANVSQPLQLPCEAQSTLTPDISWYLTSSTGSVVRVPRYNPTINSTDQRIFVNVEGYLQFQVVSSMDEGWYTCVANNSMGNISGDAYVHIQLPPDIVLASTPKSGDVGEMTTLTCTAEGDPRPEVTWRSPGGTSILYTNDQYIVSRGLLTIRVTNVEQHMGQWLCLACNVLGCDQATIDLYVRGPPKITEVHGYMDGVARVISCKAEGTPFPEMHYFWGDLAINPLFPPRGHSISLEGPTLRIVRERVGGIAYKCRAMNRYGTDTKVFTVPSEPYNLTLSDVTARSVHLQWTPPDISGGFPELNYTIDYTYTTLETPDPTHGAQLGVLETSHSLRTLQAHADYTFKVAAYNVLGSSKYTNSISAKTLQDAPTPIRQLMLSFAGEVVKVQWLPPLQMNGNTSHIEYHVVATEVTNNEVMEVVKVPHGGPLETYLTTLSYNHEYRVTVTAVNTAIGQSSNPVQDGFENRHKVPFMVPLLTRVASLGPSSIEVEWKYPEREGRQLSGFLVKLTLPDQTQAVHSISRVDGHTVREYKVLGLEERVKYSISVAGFSREGSGPYSGEEIVTTSYAVLSPLPYKDSNKLTMPGTTIAIIFGAIFGILLVLIVVLIIWQWYRLHKQKKEKMVADVYKEKPSPPPRPPPTYLYAIKTSPTFPKLLGANSGYYDVASAEKSIQDTEVSSNTGHIDTKPDPSSLPVPRVEASKNLPPSKGSKPAKAHAEPKLQKTKLVKNGISRPRNGNPYGPGRTNSYRVSPKGEVSVPVHKKIYRKRGDPSNEMPGMRPGVQRPPPYSQEPPRSRRPGHPINPRNGQLPPGPLGASVPAARHPGPRQVRPVPKVTRAADSRAASKPSRPRPAKARPGSRGTPAPGRAGDRPDAGPTQGAPVPNRQDSPPGPVRVAVYDPGPNHGSPYRGHHGGVAVNVPAMPARSLSASEENLANHQKRGPSPALSSSRSDSPHQSASGLRSSRVKRPSPPSSSLGPGVHPDTGNAPSLSSDTDGSTQLPILSRLHEAHPLPNEGRSEPSTPESVRSHPSEDYIYAQPNKVRKAPSEAYPGVRSQVGSDSSDSPPPSLEDIQDVSLDRKGRVYPSTALRNPKGKAGGRSHPKNLGRHPLPQSDFWSTDIPDNKP